MSRLWTSAVIKATAILWWIGSFKPFWINSVKVFNCFTKISYHVYNESDLVDNSLIAYWVSFDHRIWLHVVTTWLLWLRIQRILVFCFWLTLSLNPSLISFFMESIISFCMFISHISMLNLILITLLNLILSFSGLIIPSIEEGDYFSISIWPIPSKSLFICFWTIEVLTELASISTNSSFDIK